MATPQEILKQYWGYDQFRPPQEDIINTVLQRRDALALLPTGGGKSVCFQVPALAMDGLCIVITPLIALMQDQVLQLKNRGIPAVAIYSGLGHSEIDVLLDNCVYGSTKFLYVSPERLQTELFQERYKKMKVAMVAIDEAHCISQWGHDFRPPYLEIKILRELKPDITFIAVTASATNKVKEDIVKYLELKDHATFQISFARTNLSFVVRKSENKEKKMLEILKRVQGPAIVYLRSRKGTMEYAKYLERQKISSTYYHAGLNHLEREKRQEEWIQNRVRVMVATNAFGMGIDKPDVRVVIHMDIPEDLESYYQEAGRAGRDGKKAFATIVYHPSDVEGLEAKVEQSYPPVEQLKTTYQALANYYQLAVGSGQDESFKFDLEEFSKRFNIQSGVAFISLKKLEDEGLIQMSEGFYQPSRVHFQVDNKRLYEFQIANAHFEPLIKTILRLYGGEAYSGFVKISEKQLAGFLKMTDKSVVSYLDQLSKLNILDYEPASDSPTITYLTARQDAARLQIDRKRLEERRKLHMSKMKAMVNYVTQDRTCRMQVMQEYFDELNTKPCGMCDICIDRKKKEDLHALKNYREQILYLLKQKKMPVDELQTAVEPDDEEVFIEVVREMLDEGILYYDDFWLIGIK
ncbi:MAG TPA: RecQ family ATP-dependent DNA helicase [Cyclobacteriaceae bacterium]|nr:RecQ family ATP-dependent DNA helicase [Cyclobacteriaceae bacterium]